jgi:hypothetical protein
MSHNKYNINVQYSHDGFYKVSLTDHYGARTVVYEPSVERALDYALQWCREADQRKEERDTHAKAVMEMIKLDRQAGITTNTSDGLD